MRATGPAATGLAFVERPFMEYSPESGCGCGVSMKRTAARAKGRRGCEEREAQGPPSPFFVSMGFIGITGAKLVSMGKKGVTGVSLRSYQTETDWLVNAGHGA